MINFQKSFSWLCEEKYELMSTGQAKELGPAGSELHAVARNHDINLKISEIV